MTGDDQFGDAVNDVEPLNLSSDEATVLQEALAGNIEDYRELGDDDAEVLEQISKKLRRAVE